MINFKNISQLDRDYCLKKFKDLFDYSNPNLSNDKINILNFLTIDYTEAENQFRDKILNLDFIDEVIFLIEKDNEIIGYTCFFTSRWNPSTPNNIEVEMGIFLRKQDRGKSYGSQAISWMENYIAKDSYLGAVVKRLVLSPKLENDKAMRLYSNLGYDFEPNSKALAYGFIYMLKELS